MVIKLHLDIWIKGFHSYWPFFSSPPSERIISLSLFAVVHRKEIKVYNLSILLFYSIFPFFPFEYIKMNKNKLADFPDFL